jgi:hypothetical protein
MAKAIPNPDMPQRPIKPERSQTASSPESAGSHLNIWKSGHTPLIDLEETGIENPELSAAVNEADARKDQSYVEDGDHSETEVVQLRNLIVEIQRDFEFRLQEKENIVSELEQKTRDLEQAVAVKPQTPKEEELAIMAEELERERCQLQQERRELNELRQRLGDDEQAMMSEMRDVEVQMARERADFARRRTELQRILDDIRREIEKVERTGHLNQRLVQLRDRFQDMAGLPGSQGNGTASPPAKPSGFRRIFGER